MDNALPKGIPTADETGLMENRPPKAAQIPTAEGLAEVLAGRDMSPEERVEWDYAGLPERERKMSRAEFEALKENYPELARYDIATGNDPTAQDFGGFVAGERIRQQFDEAEKERRGQEKAQKAREENPEAVRNAELGYKAAGGVATSQHLSGEAADITVGSQADNRRLFELAVSLQKEGKIEFDQLIWEKGSATGPQWLHVSYRLGRNRNQILHL